MKRAKLSTSRSRSFVVFFVGLLVVINILGITGFRSLQSKAVERSEFLAWRGKSKIDFNDMVEISTWVNLLGGRMTDALKFYWVENEAYYPYAAVVRGMYAVFNETYRSKGFSPTFLEGMEVIVHYCLLKSAFVLLRHGGVRGNDQDAATLRSAVKPLQTCYAMLTKKNFTADVFPIKSRKKRMIRFPRTFRRRRLNRSIGIFQGLTKNRRVGTKLINLTLPMENTAQIIRAPTTPIPLGRALFGFVHHPPVTHRPVTHPPNPHVPLGRAIFGFGLPPPVPLSPVTHPNITRGPMGRAIAGAIINAGSLKASPPDIGLFATIQNSNSSLKTNTSKGQQGRFMYTLNRGVKEDVRKTIIDIPDVDDNRMENIAVSIFWLIYEVLPHTCNWDPAQKLAYKNAFEGIIGLVLSLYLYDEDDFGEEYASIFRIPRKKYDSEWVKIEQLAKQVQRDSKTDFRRPYSYNY